AHLVDRFQDGGHHSRRARRADGRPHDVHDRASAVHRAPCRSDCDAGSRRGGGTGHARRADRPWRTLPPDARRTSEGEHAQGGRVARVRARGGDGVSVRKKIVVLGMVSRHPVAGMVWLTMQYLIGLERLGYEAYYIEAHGATPKMFMGDDDGSTLA